MFSSLSSPLVETRIGVYFTFPITSLIYDTLKVMIFNTIKSTMSNLILSKLLEINRQGQPTENEIKGIGNGKRDLDQNLMGLKRLRKGGFQEGFKGLRKAIDRGNTIRLSYIPNYTRNIRL